MKAFPHTFVNWEQKNWARLLSIAEFVYNNAKHTSIDHTVFKPNCGYHPGMLFEDEVNPCSRFCSANKLAKKLRELMLICQRNLFHTQELQNRVHNKSVKTCSYASGEKS